MKLKAMVADLESVNEAHREFYTAFEQPDGTTIYVVDIDQADGWALENVKHLKNALAMEKGEVKRLKGENESVTGKWGELSPDKVAADLAELEKLRNAKPDEAQRAQWEDRERQLVQKYEDQLKASTSKYDTLLSQSDITKMRAEAVAALTKHNGNVDLMLPHVMQNLRVQRAAENPQDEGAVTVLDSKGVGRLTMRQGSTDLMQVDELVETMRQDAAFAQGFKPDGVAGSGAQGGTGSTTSGKFTISTADAQDVQKYRQVAEAADKAGTTVTIVD